MPAAIASGSSRARGRCSRSTDAPRRPSHLTSPYGDRAEAVPGPRRLHRRAAVPRQHQWVGRPVVLRRGPPPLGGLLQRGRARLHRPRGSSGSGSTTAKPARPAPAYRDHRAAGPSASSRTPPPPQPGTGPAAPGVSRGTNGSAPGDERGLMARGYRFRPRRPGRSRQRAAVITCSPCRAALQRTRSVPVTRSRCLRQSNPGLGPIALTTPQISIAMSVASMPGRIVPARRAPSISSAMTAISSSCSAGASAPASLLASAYWTPASPAAVCAIRRSSPSISANGSPPARAPRAPSR